VNRSNRNRCDDHAETRTTNRLSAENPTALNLNLTAGKRRHGWSRDLRIGEARLWTERASPLYFVAFHTQNTPRAKCFC